MSSPQRLLANQQNGRKGRGPVTAEGKARSSKNALRHGILACQVVLPSESAEDFAALIRDLREHYEPVGVQEELLVEEISVCYWRKRRILKTEAAAISLAKYKTALSAGGGHDHDPLNEKENDAKLRRRFPDLNDKLTLVETCQTEAREKGYVSEDLLIRLQAKVVPSDNTVECCRAYSIIVKMALDKGDHEASFSGHETWKNNILTALENLHLFETCLVQARDNISNKQAAMEVENAPLAFEVDRILRYEASVDRQLYRAIALLDVLQSRRRGSLAKELVS